MTAPQIWAVGALCRAAADALQLRFNPVAVCGEISSWTRAASGHCYFVLKDADGQMRCAMFRRAASQLSFQVADGQKVEIQGQLGVYEARGDLQLVVDSMRPAGQGVWLEQFLRLKAKLQAQGLFDSDRKRKIPPRPRAIGLVTSLGAAALRDVATALARRVPHIPVVLAPASVQGEQAPAELVAALRGLYQRQQALGLDVILLVRGGGSLEDLWAFNDEQLIHALAASPVPVICGVGHETDMTLADFVADLRAPTPTAAAELAAQPQAHLRQELQLLGARLGRALELQVNRRQQRLDLLATQLGRPADRLWREKMSLNQHQHQLQTTARLWLARHTQWQQATQVRTQQALAQSLQAQHQRLAKMEVRLQLLNPELVLQRGYAWLSDGQSGRTLSSVRDVQHGQSLRAHLSDGQLQVQVLQTFLQS